MAMKKALFLSAILAFLFITPTHSKELQALFQHASFYSPTEGPFIETYLKVFGPSAEFAKTPRGTYQASLEITVLFKQGEKITDFRKYNLLSSEIEDTVNGVTNFIDMQRIPLPPGLYQIELLVKDNHSKSSPIEHSELVSLEFDEQKLKFSDFQFVDTYKATQTENILTKSGYDLIPYVGDFYPANNNAITFYIELYNIDKKLGNQEDFLYRYYIESFETTISLGDFAKFQRQKAGPVNPLLASLPIAQLPSGNYNLVVEARDRNNQLIELNKTFFQRSNPGMQINLSDLASVDVTATFAEKITSLDSLQFYILSLVPVANMLEMQFARNASGSKEVDQMQKFLYNFWKIRNESNPEAEWNRYKSIVFMVEDAYKTKIKHGFETDMGRVMLKYGVPDDVVDSRHEPNAYPYVIWHFYHLADQNNKRFIFYNPHLVGTEYILIHSDAKGEIYNADWQKVLVERNINGRTVTESWGDRFGENYLR